MNRESEGHSKHLFSKQKIGRYRLILIIYIDRFISNLIPFYLLTPN